MKFSATSEDVDDLVVRFRSWCSHVLMSSFEADDGKFFLLVKSSEDGTMHMGV